MDESRQKESKKRNPLENSNFISNLFLCWLNDIISKGFKRSLTIDDLYSPVAQHESKCNTDLLDKEWNAEMLKKSRPSLLRAILKTCYLKLLFNILISITVEFTIFLQPFLVSKVLEYFNNQIDLQMALVYGAIMCLVVLYTTIAYHTRFFNLLRIGLNNRLACSGLIYRKMLKQNLVAKETSAGQTLNLLSNDVSTLEDMFYFLPYLITSPLKIAGGIYLLVKMIGFRILTGIILTVLSILLTIIISRFNLIFKKKSSQMADERLNLLSEVFDGIKVIKMFAWEEAFCNRINEIRKREMKYVGGQYIVTATYRLIHTQLISLLVYVSLAVFVHYLADNKPLLPIYVVFTIGYYSKLSNSVGELAAFSGSIATNYTSIKRIEAFLKSDEIVQLNDRIFDDGRPFIKITNLNASWKTNDATKQQFTLSNINLEVNDKELVAVIGQVGSGKTSLLMSILSEMQLERGGVQVNGSMFYVSQEPWIFSASLKQNILFGQPYEKKKFDLVIRVCCLHDDLRQLPRGINTIVGEKGINLSGGQRARVGLARAVYSDAQIYLFDDPLSAVDSQVAKNIFEHCLNGYLSNRIRILVTHQIHHLTKLKRVVLMNNGQIESIGSIDELSNKHESLFKLLDNSEENSERVSCLGGISNSMYKSYSTYSLNNESIYLTSDLSLSQRRLAFDDDQDDQDNDQYEEKCLKHKSCLKLYFYYLKSNFKAVGIGLFYFIFVMTQITWTCADYWLANWSSKEVHLWKTTYQQFNSTYHNHTAFKQQRNHYFLVYSILVWLAFSLGVFRSIFYFSLCVRNLKNIHKKMFDRIVRAPIRFFDLNPLGRIINRFSKDMSNVDNILSVYFYEVHLFTFYILGAIVFSIYLNYWVVFSIVPLTVLLFIFRKYYIKSSKQIRNLEAIYRSPIAVHVSNTLNGMITIRACGREETMKREFEMHCDQHTRAYFAYLAITRWFGIRLNIMLFVYLVTATFSSICAKEALKLTAGTVGILLIQLFQLLDVFQWTIRLTCDTEDLLISLGRIKEYSTVEIEKLNECEMQPPADWPKNGQIEFKNVSFSYDSDLPNVLQNLTFEIKAGEKVGIVGRTGAGKSSIIQSLFRMAKQQHSSEESMILIDNLDISKISLHALRSKIAIIPQEPTLFLGTIRSNLDPFNEYADTMLWYALEQVQLKEIIKREMKDGLDAEIQKNGSNLSVGQKQLMCLARAILKKSKILMIDEATANVDFKTDSLVQKAIRECFGECTVITIAHRLQTIADSDRIMCLKDGCLDSYDTPQELLVNKDSTFSQLVDNLNQYEKEAFYLNTKNNFNFDISSLSSSSSSSNTSRIISSHTEDTDDDIKVVESSPFLKT